ncbi:hypothetical protein [Azohydromonas aeria]|uniref:hypothetical protein n=1 Tax=Azohydromonas aeria TaxID=2590212 RepID=UPI0012F9FB2E|nr:hypothetical protein [Azohydromonas aeria]
MFSTLDPQPPQLLHAVYARLSRRYGAPGVRLADFAGRWLVYRTVDLAAGLERAVIDVEPPRHDTVEGLAEIESRAEFAVGEDHDATLVLMELTSRPRTGHGPHAAPNPPVLTITVWSLAHSMAVTGDIELDVAGTPVRIGTAALLPRANARR